MNLELEAEVENVVARCVTIVITYDQFAKTWQDWVEILDKIQLVSLDAEISELSLDVMGPMIRLELLERFPPETALRLSREFLDMFATVSSLRMAMTADR